MSGKIVWTDLTVSNADAVKDFYSAVVGWTPKPFDMGGYSDYGMDLPETDETVVGICHARGENANLPPQWLVYIEVENLDESIAQCEALGGTVMVGPRAIGKQRMCVIRDPAGAVCGLITK